jgi:hypothetical protein
MWSPRLLALLVLLRLALADAAANRRVSISQ